jgi:hypothetical protein
LLRVPVGLMIDYQCYDSVYRIERALLGRDCK